METDKARRIARILNTLLFCVSLSFTLAASAAYGGQEFPKWFPQLSDAQALAGFQCAALAAIATGEPSIARDYGPEVDRLFSYGVEKSRSTFPSDGAALRKTLGDVGPWHEIKNMSRDFLIGEFFTSVNVDTSKLIDDEVRSAPGDPLQAIVKLQASAADGEFQKRNCYLVGR